MATKIQVLDDTIKIDKTFTSAKDRVSINGETVFEGKMGIDSRQKLRVGDRDYAVEVRKVGKLGATAVHLQIHEDNELIHSGVYDQAGKPANGDGQVAKNGALHLCAVVGAFAGVAMMLYLNMATGVVPGGAIGGAIGGGVGAMIGHGIRSLFIGRK